ncbi:MAG TPA: hypothetical protein VM099_04975 [Gemmatimonadaceae bacterium]|nr:hypothetical protein [Gemmatimonadaceae bacterium]
MRPRTWLIALSIVGCKLPEPQPPAAEFLVADGSSTYWVTSSKGGIHARVSPLILARANGHYYEVFVGESTRSYDDAIFSAEPIFRRDLVTGDTTLLWQDPKITAWESVYLSRNPSARLLDPDEGDEDAVSLSATAESDILGVVGPYVLYTHRSMIQNADIERADTARGIIDVGHGKSVSMSALARDTTSFTGGGTRVNGVTRWQHNGYEVVARFDTARAQSEMMLKDKRHRVWKLGYVNSALPRIFWLDEPRIDARVRTALAHAFEGALSDDDFSQLVSRRLNRSALPRIHSQ